MTESTSKSRSRNMSRIRSANTKPELVVRRTLHAMGFRYRLHAQWLPGIPDIVFTKKRKVIFVHGCFWHQHAGCPRAVMPRTNRSYWQPKLAGNVTRDRVVGENLRNVGWKVLVIWECEIKRQDVIAERMSSFLLDPSVASARRRRPAN
jgi:DNA mismatch endonuclease, patch repair protein